MAIEESAEGRNVGSVGHGFDVGPSAALGESVAQGVAVVSAVGQQDLSRLHLLQHVVGAPPRCYNSILYENCLKSDEYRLSNCC